MSVNPAEKIARNRNTDDALPENGIPFQGKVLVYLLCCDGHGRRGVPA